MSMVMMGRMYVYTEYVHALLLCTSHPPHHVDLRGCARCQAQWHHIASTFPVEHDHGT